VTCRPAFSGSRRSTTWRKEDYENVLVPAINQAISEHGKVRLVYVFGERFDDYEGRPCGRT
jgi:hypothetical protein